MLSYLDPIIFPDDYVVLKLAPDRFIYPIFKNGSSTLYSLNLKPVQDLSNIEVIDVIIRDPYERFYSGVSSYLHFLTETNPAFDKETALFFIREYLFLNRHFCPQFYWLINLRRFTNAKFRLLPMAALSDITDAVVYKNFVDPQLKNKFNNKLDFYLQLDKILHEDLINHTVSLEEILSKLKERFPMVYSEVINRTKNICSVLG